MTYWYDVSMKELIKSFCWQVIVSLDETVTENDLNDLLYVFGSPATVVRLSIYVDLKLA